MITKRSFTILLWTALAFLTITNTKNAYAEETAAPAGTPEVPAYTTAPTEEPAATDLPQNTDFPTDTPPVETPPAETPPEETSPAEETDTPPSAKPSKAPASPVPLTQAVINKGHWKKKDGNKYFKVKNGIYVKGVVKIHGKIYVFSTKGKPTTPSRLLTGNKDRVLKIKKKWYHVNKKGIAMKGWYLTGRRLYCFNGKRHCAITKRKVDHIRFNKSGYAVKDANSDVKITSMKILKKITRKGDSKYAKLLKAFSYMTNPRKWQYLPKYPDMDNPLWPRVLGGNMLSTHSGNCFGFACGFAALAHEIGYNPKVIYGRVHGRRDRKPDGFTRHGLVKIEGKYYDPEGWWKGFVHVRGSTRYPITLKILKIVPF